MSPRRGPNARALEETIAALAAAGRPGPGGEALVALARSLATAVDFDPTAALFREYRAALSVLSLVGADEPDDDSAAFLRSIATPAVRAALGDAADTGEEEPRPPDRRRGPAPRDGADALAAPGGRRGRRARP